MWKTLMEDSNGESLSCYEHRVIRAGGRKRDPNSVNCMVSQGVPLQALTVVSYNVLSVSTYFSFPGAAHLLWVTVIIKPLVENRTKDQNRIVALDVITNQVFGYRNRVYRSYLRIMSSYSVMRSASKERYVPVSLPSLVRQQTWGHKGILFDLYFFLGADYLGPKTLVPWSISWNW